MTSFRIGKLSSKARVPVSAIRYYERQGLLREPDRPGGKFRSYAEADIHRLRLIRDFQGLGFRLEEIRSLLKKGSGAARRKQALVRAINAKLDEAAKELSRLRRVRTMLARVRACWVRGGDVSRCQLHEYLGS